MTLLEVVGSLQVLDAEATIYAVKPWTGDSSCLVAPEPEGGGLPEEAQKYGAAYFLEVFVARDFLSDFVSRLERLPSEVEMCDRLIKYAINDA